MPPLILGLLVAYIKGSHQQRTRDEGDWESWLEFFLTGVSEVSGQATQTARRILALREEHRNAIAEHLGRAAGNGHKVLESLYRRPIINVKAVKDITGTSFPAANELVSRLTRSGILKEITMQRRNRSFRYEQYVEMFA